MLLRSRILVAKYQLTTASSLGAVARLPAVSLTHKLTTSSLASSSSNNRCHDNRARVRARIIKYLKASASSVVALATKCWSVKRNQGTKMAEVTRPLESSTLNLLYRTHRELSERAILGAWREA